MPRPNVKILRGEPAGMPGPIEAERLYLDIDGVEHMALMSRDEVDAGTFRWHISLSISEHSPDYGKDVPIWRNLVAVAHTLRPGVCFCVPVPPESQWYNCHPGVLHVYELGDPSLERHFRDQHDMARKLEAAEPKIKGITEPS